MNVYDVLKVNRANIKKAIEVAKAIIHPERLHILEVMQQKGRANVTQIYFALRMEQSVASQHLAILRKAGVVKTEREGKHIHYSIDEDVLGNVIRLFSMVSEVNLPGRLPGSIYMHNVHHPDELKHFDGPGGEEASNAGTDNTPAPDAETAQAAATE